MIDPRMPDPAPIVIELPTPFGVATVNAYLIPDDPLTLVDTGVATVAGLDALESGLARAGYRVEDLRRIVLTHHHLDHFGLAAALVRRSGAEVWAFAGVTDWLADYDRRMAEETTFIIGKYVRHGLPQSIALGLRAADTITRGYGEAVRVDRALLDGDTVPFAHREWTVHHRPGHSTSDLVFHDRSRRELLGGDHLIGHISSNALVHEPLRTDVGPADPADRVSPLRDYVSSLERTRTMDVDVVLPGHGAPVTDHRRLIDQRAASTERRLRRIVAEVAAGRQTGYDIARSVWGDTASLQVQLVMSEVLGHLDVLEHDGRLVVDDSGDTLRFRVPEPGAPGLDAP
jgi:glyoxylase-like metal-dependent hydrolase (beta-lactamase superfamily II)